MSLPRHSKATPVSLQRACHDSPVCPTRLTQRLSMCVSRGWVHAVRPSNSMAVAIGDERIKYCYSRRIDYVFVGTPGLDGAGHVESCEVVGDDRFGAWPSDHFGVFVKLRAPAPADSNIAAPKL